MRLILKPATLMSKTAKSNAEVRANGSAASILPASATTRCPSSSSISTIIIRIRALSSTKNMDAPFLKPVNCSEYRRSKAETRP